MCLDYGTPHRFIRVYAHGVDYPLACDDKSMLQQLLREELGAGVYTADKYHPALISILTALSQEDCILPPGLQEPHSPFCDLIQSVGLVFGFINNTKHVPTLEFQQLMFIHGWKKINPEVYAIARVLLTTLCPQDIVDEWYPVMHQGRPEQVALILVLEVGLRKGFMHLHADEEMAGDHAHA